MTEIDPYVAALPKAIVDISCAGDTHQLVWSGGTFTTLDHADPEGERMLSALGGPRARCIALLDAWQRRHHDLGLFAVASRGVTDRLTFDDPSSPGLQFVSSQQHSAMSRLRRAAGHVTGSFFSSASVGGWVTSSGSAPAVAGGPDPTDEDDYPELLSLGGGLPERLVAEAAAHWARRIAGSDVGDTHWPSLEAALYGRVLATIDAWLPGDAALDLTMVGPDEQPSLSRHPDHLEARLPFHWLSRVWALGMAVTAGQLVLDVHLDGSDMHLDAVAPDGTPTTLTLNREPG